MPKPDMWAHFSCTKLMISGLECSHSWRNPVVRDHKSLLRSWNRGFSKIHPLFASLARSSNKKHDVHTFFLSMCLTLPEIYSIVSIAQLPVFPERPDNLLSEKSKIKGNEWVFLENHRFKKLQFLTFFEKSKLHWRDQTQICKEIRLRCG